MRLLASVLLLVCWTTLVFADDKLIVNKEEGTVTVPCFVALRKLPTLNDIYPIEVIASYPHDGPVKGQKAHETVVTIKGIKNSEIHQALVDLGLKPGKPAKGEGAKAEGPEIKLHLEVPGPDGEPKRLPIERTLVDRKTGKPMPSLKWYFTGSTLTQPNPDKPEKVFGADLSGTLIAVFPVTDECVIQSSLTMKDEPLIKLEVNKAQLPAEGKPVKLVIQVVK
jgi:hypothetical protein